VSAVSKGIMTVQKLYMLVAIRYAETLRGVDYWGKIDRQQTAIARSLANEGYVAIGRADPPDHGMTVRLTDAGRAKVDSIVDLINREREAS